MTRDQFFEIRFFKRKNSFIYKGAHGSGRAPLGWAWGLGYNWWVVLNFLLFGLSGWEPEFPPCPNIHIIMREGVVTGGLSQMVTWSARLSWPRSCSETHFYVSICLTWVGPGLHHFHAGEAPASNFRPDSSSCRASVSSLEVGPFLSFLGLAQRGPWKPLIVIIIIIIFSV